MHRYLFCRGIFPSSLPVNFPSASLSEHYRPLVVKTYNTAAMWDNIYGGGFVPGQCLPWKFPHTFTLLHNVKIPGSSSCLENIRKILKTHSTYIFLFNTDHTSYYLLVVVLFKDILGYHRHAFAVYTTTLVPVSTHWKDVQEPVLLQTWSTALLCVCATSCTSDALLNLHGSKRDANCAEPPCKNVINNLW